MSHICPTKQGARRRLLQSSATIILTVKATYTGTTTGSAMAVQAVQQAGCSGVTGLCDTLQNVTVERGYISANVQPGNLTLSVQTTKPTEPITVTAVYTEGDEAISLPVGLTVQPANAMACIKTQKAASQVFTCQLVRQVGSVLLTAVAPNPQNPSARFVVTASVTDLGETTCLNGLLVQLFALLTSFITPQIQSAGMSGRLAQLMHTWLAVVRAADVAIVFGRCSSTKQTHAKLSFSGARGFVFTVVVPVSLPLQGIPPDVAAFCCILLCVVLLYSLPLF
jgi:hypothetical protein